MLYTRDQKAQALDNLPETVRKVVTSDKINETIRKITQKYNLRIDQGSNFSEIVIATILGIERPEDFQKNIMKHVRVGDVVASGLTKDAEEMIFSEIKEELMNLTKEKVEEEKQSPNPDQVLSEIENPEGEVDYSTYTEGTTKADVETSAIQKSAPKQEVVSEEEAKTRPAPENLPVGDIKDVPIHGHGHQNDIKEETPQTNTQPETTPEVENKKEVDSIINEKMSKPIKSEHESLKLNLSKADLEESPKEIKSKTNPNYSTADPYREPIE